MWGKTRLVQLARTADGFSLVEVLIATGLIGLLGIGVAELARQNQRGVMTATTQAGMNEVRSMSLAAIRDAIHCRDNVVPVGGVVNVNGETNVNLRNIVNYNATLSGLRYQPKIQELQLINTLSGGEKAYVGVVHLEASGVGAEATRRYGSQTLEAEIPIVLRVSATNQMLSCSLDSSQYTTGANSVLIGGRTAQECFDQNGVLWPATILFNGNMTQGNICRVPNMDPKAPIDLSQVDGHRYVEIDSHHYGKPFANYCPAGWTYTGYAKTTATLYQRRTCHSGGGQVTIPGSSRFRDLTNAYNPPLPYYISNKSGSMPYCDSWTVPSFPLVNAVGCI